MGLYFGYIGAIFASYWGYIRAILGLYWGYIRAVIKVKRWPSFKDVRGIGLVLSGLGPPYPDVAEFYCYVGY